MFEFIVIAGYGVLCCLVGFWIGKAPEPTTELQVAERALSAVDLEAIATAVWDREFLDPVTRQPRTISRLVAEIHGGVGAGR